MMIIQKEVIEAISSKLSPADANIVRTLFEDAKKYADALHYIREMTEWRTGDREIGEKITEVLGG